MLCQTDPSRTQAATCLHHHAVCELSLLLAMLTMCVPCCVVSLPVQVLRNTWRLCHSYVDPSCLLERDSDICVAQHLEQLLKGQQQGAGPGQLSPGATAAAGMLCHV